MQPNVTQTFTPEQQRIFDTNQQGQQGLADLGVGAVGRAGSILGQNIDFSGAPGVQQVNTGALPHSASVLDTNSLQPIGSAEATRKAVTDAMLSRVNTDIARQRDNTASTLIAQGIPRGSEAWNREMDALNRQETDARYQADLAGTQAAATQVGQDLSIRGQQAGFQGQQYGQESGNIAQALAAQEAAQRGSTAARQQAITEILARRQTPLNEINAFRSGSQVAPLSFQPYTGATVAPPPIFGAATATGQAQQNQYNAGVAQSNGMLSGLFNLGGAALGAPVGTFRF